MASLVVFHFHSHTLYSNTNAQCLQYIYFTNGSSCMCVHYMYYAHNRIHYYIHSMSIYLPKVTGYKSITGDASYYYDVQYVTVATPFEQHLSKSRVVCYIEAVCECLHSIYRCRWKNAQLNKHITYTIHCDYYNTHTYTHIKHTASYTVALLH